MTQITESLIEFSPEVKDILKRLEAATAFGCATEGHQWCDHVIGIEGIICVACGERPDQEEAAQIFKNAMVKHLTTDSEAGSISKNGGIT